MSQLLSKSPLRELLIKGLALPFAVSDSDDSEGSGDSVSASISSLEWTLIVAVHFNGSINLFSRYQLSFQLAVTRSLRGFRLLDLEAGATYSVYVYQVTMRLYF